jgi:hypothetical protein
MDVMERTEELIAHFVGDKTTCTITASTIGEVQRLLEPFTTRTTEPGTIAVWPMVTSIPFHFHDILVLAGVKYIDTSGLRDRGKFALLNCKVCCFVLLGI